ncbi:tRNA uridine-5-carboxymethylaminomethyl(34) synthesis GTPase MnmE [Pseudorhizobium sp. NPDC055634]
MSVTKDTIFALSSGALPAGVAVVRISGPEAFPALSRLTSSAQPEPRKAALRRIRSRDGRMIDEALVLTFPAPHSFTGENVVELHLHGSRAVVNAVSAELGDMEGLRAAEAGEFSRRAFENGRLDLVEAEGLSELISAETEMQRRLAVEQSFGGQSRLYQTWAERLTHARAMIEAELDFADEDDVPGSVGEQVTGEIAAVAADLEAHLKSAKGGEIIRDGFKVAIVGAPNAGKSSLLNYLANRDVAIVTDVAGTTRDVLHIDLDMDGYLVRLFDTAGIRHSTDAIEQEGIRRARQMIEKADLVLQLEEIGMGAEVGQFPNALRVGTKSDIHPASQSYDLCLSTVTGDGIDTLRENIISRIRSAWSGSVAPTRERQLTLLRDTSISLQAALNTSELELRAEHLRRAAVSLGRITGHVDVEQLLDVIFSQFCIGK